MRVYEVSMNGVSVSTGITIVQLVAGSSSVLTILRAWCSQSNLTSSTQQTIEIVRKSVAATVTAFTPLLLDPGDAASNMAAGTGTNATVEGTDTNVVYRDNFNILNGWLWIPVPEERIIVPPSGIIALKFPAAPGAAITVSAGFLVGEIG